MSRAWAGLLVCGIMLLLVIGVISTGAAIGGKTYLQAQQEKLYETAHTCTVIDIDTNKVIVKVKLVYKIHHVGGKLVLFSVSDDSTVRQVFENRYWFGSKNVRIDW